MVDAASRLRPRGIAIITLKLGSHRPYPKVRAALRRLRTAYDVSFARQLQHNRHEITVVAEARSDR